MEREEAASIFRGHLQHRFSALVACALVVAAFIPPVRSGLWLEDSLGHGAAFDKPLVDADWPIARVQLDAIKTPANDDLLARLRTRAMSGRLRGDFSVARDSVSPPPGLGRAFRRERGGTPSRFSLAYDVITPQVAPATMATVTAAHDRRPLPSHVGVRETASVNLMLALFPWLESGGHTGGWSSKIGYGFQQIRQLMEHGTTPAGEPSRGELSATIHSLGAEWSERWMTVAYRLNVPASDALDPRVRRPDDAVTAQRLTAQLQPRPGFDLRGGLERSRPRGRDVASRRATLGIDWMLTPFAGLAVGCDLATLDGPGKRGCTVLGEVERELRLFGKEPLHVFAQPSFGHRREDGGLDVASNEWGLSGGIGFRF